MKVCIDMEGKGDATVSNRRLIKDQNNKRSLLFIANGNRTLGLGHLCRCRSLAKCFLIKGNFSISVISRNISIAKQIFSGIKGTLLFDSWKTLKQRQFDIIVADIPGLSLSQQNKIKSFAKLFVCIDDEDPGPFCADVVVRPNLLNMPKPSFVSQQGLYLKGNKNIILDPAFNKAHHWNGRNTGEANSIFICFGGSDPFNITAYCVSLLIKMSCMFHAEIIVGTAYKELAKLKRAIGKDGRFSLRCNVPNIEALIVKSDFAIISGGTFLYEACFLGVPSLVVNQNAEQNQEASIFEKAKAIVNVGIFNSKAKHLFIGSLSKLIADNNFRNRLSKNSQSFLSSFGTFNIVDAIDNYFLKKTIFCNP